MSVEHETSQPSRGGIRLQPNTVSGTLLVAAALCLVCSLTVSGAAVLLRPWIAANKQLKMQRNVLEAVGLFDPARHTDADIPRLFENVETVLVNLPGRTSSGALDVDDEQAGTINRELSPATYDARKAAKDPKQSVRIPPDLDRAGIKRRERVAAVYLVKGEDGRVTQIVVPIYGKGLWSTLYGFLALSVEDGMPVTGITFYEHAETPGLGGEVDNEHWKAQWAGKHLFTEGGAPRLDVTKPGQAEADNQIDGLSGATITSNGVENLVNYWLGEDGFGPFLRRFRSGEFNFDEDGATANAGGPAEFLSESKRGRGPGWQGNGARLRPGLLCQLGDLAQPR